MNIGALDRKITIQSKTDTVSGTTGERVPVWATYAQVWATVTYPKNQASDEKNENGKRVATTPVEFTIYHRSDITELMRVYFDSQYFDIMRINRAGQRNEMLKLVTEKKV